LLKMEVGLHRAERRDEAKERKENNRTAKRKEEKGGV